MSDLLPPAIGIGAIVACLALVVWAVDHDAKQWAAFSEAHHCRVVGKMAASSVPTYGVDSRGNATFGAAYVSGKTGYLCDDGVTYWRDE